MELRKKKCRKDQTEESKREMIVREQKRKYTGRTKNLGQILRTVLSPIHNKMKNHINVQSHKTRTCLSPFRDICVFCV